MTKLLIILWSLVAAYLLICYIRYVDVKLEAYDTQARLELEEQERMRDSRFNN